MRNPPSFISNGKLPMRLSQAISLLFLTANMSVSYAQNVTNKGTQDGAFPDAATTRQSWDAKEKAKPKATLGKAMVDPVGIEGVAANRATSLDKANAKVKRTVINNDAEGLTEQEELLLQQAIESTAPMSPALVRKFSEALHARSVAGSDAPGGPYKTLNRMVKLNLSPGSTPEKITLALGQGAVVSFVDRNGKYLIIDSVKSHSKAFSVYIPETETHANEGASSFALEAKTIAGIGNVSILIKAPQGQPTPVVLQIESGRSKTIDAHVQLVHPTLVNPAGVIAAGDAMQADAQFSVGEMQPFLAGIAPDKAVELTVPSRFGDLRAWHFGSRVYLRTTHSVISPAWYKKQAAMDGTAVYQLPMTPLIKLSVAGLEADLTLDLPYAKIGE